MNLQAVQEESMKKKLKLFFVSTWLCYIIVAIQPTKQVTEMSG